MSNLTERFKKLGTIMAGGIALQKINPSLYDELIRFNHKFQCHDSPEIKIAKVCIWLNISVPEETKAFANWKKLHFSDDETNRITAQKLVNGLCREWRRIALNLIDFDKKMRYSLDQLDAFRYSMCAFREDDELHSEWGVFDGINKLA